MKAERMQILKMLEEGKISAEEAVKLLDTVEAEGPASPRAPRRFLRVRVVDGDQEKVNINIPLSLARVGLQIAGRFEKRLEDIDIDSILSEVDEDSKGRIVEIVDGEQRVEVYLE